LNSPETEQFEPTPLHRLAHSLNTARRSVPHARIGGVVVQASPTHYRVAGISPHVQIGDCVEYDVAGRSLIGQVVRIDSDAATVKSFDENANLGLGHPIWLRGPLTLAPDATWKGRVLDALARPIDNKGSLAAGPRELPTDGRAPDALARQRISRPLSTGIKTIDLFTPLCAGQRIGIFAGSGVGKSTLLGMLARSNGFDTCVIALVGERGREVREFLDDSLGDRLAQSVVVVATGDESPMMRRQASRTAMLTAEVFRDRGDSVLLIVDSVTRYAHALREVGLASGEPPVVRGYTPSVFADLPRLLERAGPGPEGSGSITGIFSVLVDGDDHNEPVADAVRGILDGHIILERAIAERGQFPAVNILRSMSRLADKAWTAEQKQVVWLVRAMIAEYEDSRDLRLMGAYKPGHNAELDRAMKVVPRLYDYLTQAPEAPVQLDVFQDLSMRMATWH
jgi:flagellum-specific ATP synthase